MSLDLITGDADGFARRPDAPAQAGRPVPLLANLFEIRFNDNAVVHQYDIETLPYHRPRVNELGEEIPWEVRLDENGKEKGRRPRHLLGGNERKEKERKIDIKVLREIFMALQEQAKPELKELLATAAYDGRKALYIASSKPILPFGESFKHVVEMPSNTPTRKPRLFEVTMRHVSQISLSALIQYVNGTTTEFTAVAIQALDVLLRHEPSNRPNVVVGGQGRKFFNPNEGVDIGGGARLLRGFFQSIRPIIGKLVVNLDTAASPYMGMGPLADVMFAMVGRAGGGGGGGRGGFRNGRGGGFNDRNGGGGGRADPQMVDRPLQPNEQRTLKKMRGSRVRVTHRMDRREFKIRDFAKPGNAQMITIKDRETKQDRELTVTAYFKEKYNFDDPFPNTNCVQLADKTYCLVAALELTGGAAIPPTRLTGEQAATMIRETAVRPDKRKEQIDQVRRDNAYESNSRLKGDWNVRVQPSMMEVPGRVLNPPTVQYHTSSRKANPDVRFGAWNLVDCQYVQPGIPLEHWAVVSLSRMPLQAVQSFVGQLVNQCCARGMKVPNATPHIEVQESGGDILGTLKRACREVVTHARNTQKVPPQLLLIISDDRHIYGDIKRFCFFDFPVPVVSQVVLAQKIQDERKLPQYCGNVSMKMNLKTFGSNWVLGPTDTPKLTKTTMLIGADVTHPPQTRGSEEAQTSVAALVGQQAGGSYVYKSQVREQLGRQEIIDDWGAMAKNLILNFQANSGGQLPEVLIVYRDGVSEGQYKAVNDYENTALKDACHEIDPRYNPKITFIVCAKRHNFRFFPKDPSFVRMDRTGNLPAGTVVDKVATHPFVWDFFLQAHAGLQGTAKFTHYICLLDENDFGSDQLQKLTNNLCYSYARATRSVSLCPPAYYADQVCTKARALVYNDDDTMSMASGQRGQMPSINPTRLQERFDKVVAGFQFANQWWS